MGGFIPFFETWADSHLGRFPSEPHTHSIEETPFTYIHAHPMMLSIFTKPNTVKEYADNRDLPGL